MKKIFLLICFFLFICSSSIVEGALSEIAQELIEESRSNSIISPTDDLGLFIEESEFVSNVKKMLSQELNVKIIESYTENNVRYYLLSDDSVLFYTLNKYEKINDFCLIGDITNIQDLFNDFIFIFLSSGVWFDYNNEYLSATQTLAKTAYFSSNNYILFRQVNNNDVSHCMIPQTNTTIFNSNCDFNYSGACIPKDKDSLSCKDIGIRNFFVIGRDIYNFDPDHNGVCCEPDNFKR